MYCLLQVIHILFWVETIEMAEKAGCMGVKGKHTLVSSAERGKGVHEGGKKGMRGQHEPPLLTSINNRDSFGTRTESLLNFDVWAVNSKKVPDKALHFVLHCFFLTPSNLPLN